MIGFIKKLFSKKESVTWEETGYVTLLDIVEKKNNLEEGVFANINNDIMDLKVLDYPKNIAMSYAYARRCAAAGLLLQGIFKSEDYTRAKHIFNIMQLKTYECNPHDKTNAFFQEKCADESVEFIMSYDKRLKKEIISLIVMIVESCDNKDTLIRINDYNTLIRHIYSLMA